MAKEQGSGWMEPKGGGEAAQESGSREAQRGAGSEAEAQSGGEAKEQSGGEAGQLYVTIRRTTRGMETRYRAEVDGAFGEGTTRKRALGNLWDRHPEAFPPIEVQETSAGFIARFKDDPGIALSSSEAKRTSKRAVGALLLELGSELGIEISDEA